MECVKALSIKDPWANLIYTGQKTIETRTWSTDHRGLLLLCCTQKPDSHLSGKAFALANLIECRPMIKADEGKALCKAYRGAYSWVLRDVSRVELFDVRGQLGLYDVPLHKVYKEGSDVYEEGVHYVDLYEHKHCLYCGGTFDESCHRHNWDKERSITVEVEDWRDSPAFKEAER